jgi:UDP-N-acetylmuramoyl-L-alanyl-D-glutamate--2,6-diaminopimelate ligase
MKLLKDILYKAGTEEVAGSTSVPVSMVCFDSRKVTKDSLFVAVRGTLSDGHRFIDAAIEKGAGSVLCEELPAEKKTNVTYVKVKDSGQALGVAASNYFGNPSEKLKLVGITGTNGKTTTATLLFLLFRKLGFGAGLISTVKNQINDQVIPATHTTPDAIQLNALLAAMADEGCRYCFMEVSSHAVAQKRIAGLEFAGGVFTNITHDHLDYHKTFDEYLKAKKSFFDQLGSPAFALVNQDDKNFSVMLQNTKAEKKTFSLKSMSDYKAKILENSFSGLTMNIDGRETSFRLIGSFNAYNLLAVYAAASRLGQEKINILTALSDLPSVEGRFEYVQNNNVIGIIDYAHTPDALQNVLATISDIRTGNEQVITVVGCGGDRDTAKRPVMAKIACSLSNRVILTSDNPRSENPDEIIRQMQQGVPPEYYKKVLSITDRKEAIRTACSLSRRSDIILVAGKGHEKYQEIQGVKHPFDDKQILEEAMRANCGSN